MKKFVFPEINAVELSGADAIMNSAEFTGANKVTATDLQITEDFKEWQGFGD